MQGRRLEGRPEGLPEPGDYFPVTRDGERVWMACCPDGSLGDLSDHDVIEHEDGTITVSPSILVRGGRDMQQELWHGYLERGVWREV